MILRDRQKEIFVQRYTAALCANAGQAAIDAGIDADEAARIAEGWLKESLVQKRIDELLRPIIREHDITRARIIEQYARIAFHDPRRCFHEDGKPMMLHEIPFDDITALAEYSVTKFGPKFKFESKKAALDKLAEIMRVISPEETDNAGVTIQLVNFEYQPPSEFD
jgi:hypothetical protein